MRHTAAIAALLLAGCSAPQGQYGPGGRFALPLKADPSQLVATEIAFARAAQENGQWTAFANYAAANAVMFVPQGVAAPAWLRGQANPTQAVRWQVHEVWSSCDGSLAVTRSAAQWPDGAPGRFVTVWERQRNDRYRWVAHQGERLAQPLAAPELIATSVAACDPVPAAQATMPASAAPNRPQGSSTDGTLHWSIQVDPSCRRTTTISLWRGAEAGRGRVLESTVEPPRAEDGAAPPACG